MKKSHRKAVDSFMKRQMDTRIIRVPFSETEILLLHAMRVLGDGRQSLNKLVKKRISPIAIRILEENRYGESD